MFEERRKQKEETRQGKSFRGDAREKEALFTTNAVTVVQLPTIFSRTLFCPLAFSGALSSDATRSFLIKEYSRSISNTRAPAHPTFPAHKGLRLVNRQHSMPSSSPFATFPATPPLTSDCLMMVLPAEADDRMLFPKGKKNLFFARRQCHEETMRILRSFDRGMEGSLSLFQHPSCKDMFYPASSCYCYICLY